MYICGYCTITVCYVVTVHSLVLCISWMCLVCMVCLDADYVCLCV